MKLWTLIWILHVGCHLQSSVRHEALDPDLDFARWLSSVRHEALDPDLDFERWLSFVVVGSS